jgi:hypothetical protein
MNDDTPSAVPIACTLDRDELKSRFAEIAALADRALVFHRQDGRTLHLRFALDAAEQLARLVDQERQCCAFLRFDLHREPDAVHLDITAPAQAGEFAPQLYAHFRGNAEPIDRGSGPSCGADCSKPASHD